MKKQQSVGVNRKETLRSGWRVSCRWLLLGVIAFGAVLRFYQLGAQSFWGDEVLTVSLSSAPLSQVADGVRRAEQIPPLWHYVMHAWLGLAGVAEGSARVPAALFGLASIAAIYWLGQTLFDAKSGLMAAALTAVSSFNVVYSQEARPYTLLLLMALLSSVAFARVMRAGGWRNGCLYVVCTAVLYWTHLFGVIVVAAQQVAYLSSLRRGGFDGQGARVRVPLGEWCILTSLPVVLFAPWVPTVLTWTRGVSGTFWIPPVTWTVVARSYVSYAGSVTLLALMGALTAWGLARGRFDWRVVLLAGLALLPVLIPYIVSLAMRPVFVPRYGIVATAGLYLLASRGVTTLPGRWIGCMVLAVLICLSLWPLPARRGLSFKPDFHGAVDALLAQARPGDCIYVRGNGYTALAPRHYLHDVDPTLLRVVLAPEAVPAAGLRGETLWLLGMPDDAEAGSLRATAAGWRRLTIQRFAGAQLERWVK